MGCVRISPQFTVFRVFQREIILLAGSKDAPSFAGHSLGNTKYITEQGTTPVETKAALAHRKLEHLELCVLDFSLTYSATYGIDFGLVVPHVDVWME